MMRITKITDEVFARGWLTRKEISAEVDSFYEEAQKKWKQGKVRLTFDECREKVNRYKNAKNRHERGKVLVYLAYARWGGLFDACDIANILLSEASVDIAVQMAMGQLDEWERKYETNKAQAKVLEKGIKQVIPSTWRHEFVVNYSNVLVRFKPAKCRMFVGESISEATNIYYFLKMVLLVRPMLTSAHIPFDFNTFSTMVNVWSMGESKIAYGCHGWGGKKIIESEKKAWKDYFADYKLPDNIKIAILDCLQEGIADVKRDVSYDAEGVSYNSLVRAPFPATGLWMDAE